MASLNIERVFVAHKDREKEEQKKTFRRKALLILIHSYLEEFGNMDFESYYFLKYQKVPLIVKKVPEDKKKQAQNGKGKHQRFKKDQKNLFTFRKHIGVVAENKLTDAMQVFPFCASVEHENFCSDVVTEADSQILEPLVAFENFSDEWKSMANLIMQDIKCQNYSANWHDIIGHERAKELLKEAIVYPVKYGQLFTSVMSTWKGILLYGPPGSGKTILAHAAASESRAVFLKVSASTLLSKWRGESEKLVKVLFDLAKYYAPSVIFVDEIDSLISHRCGDHEASRRMKTEFFLQMDCLASYDKFVLFMGASNMPWELDCALIRRMEKRILISQPDAENRTLLFKKFLPPCLDIAKNVKMQINLNYEELSKATNCYSAADIELICKEAKMNCIRQAFKALENSKDGKIPSGRIFIEPLKISDVFLAIKRTKPATSELLEKYMKWRDEHGSE
ncbi:katanin p60 ATPase-containing subunit A-like 2 isoform X3 [Stegodyphus dumicola]|uniref:katanin p60 ATPase-containing subunit A-like 2 isoform X3 n=2 Tax=Stegodyphus dumicola TaxID=202533 RepID=UPI0015AFE5A4|nr:katanin p60 ATPase-containing subunit A-like 2 isoform X3 [Stegodyphus dumicola]